MSTIPPISMYEAISIEGERYLGRFRAVNKTGEHPRLFYPIFWYAGAGVVIDKETKEKYFFALETTAFRPGNDYTLEESIIYFNQKGPFYLPSLEPKVTSSEAYKKIIDLSLMQILEQVKNSKDPLPIVQPKMLDPWSLLREGLVSKKGE